LLRFTVDRSLKVLAVQVWLLLFPIFWSADDHNRERQCFPGIRAIDRGQVSTPTREVLLERQIFSFTYLELSMIDETVRSHILGVGHHLLCCGVLQNSCWGQDFARERFIRY